MLVQYINSLYNAGLTPSILLSFSTFIFLVGITGLIGGEVCRVLWSLIDEAKVGHNIWLRKSMAKINPERYVVLPVTEEMRRGEAHLGKYVVYNKMLEEFMYNRGTETQRFIDSDVLFYNEQQAIKHCKSLESISLGYMLYLALVLAITLAPVALAVWIHHNPLSLYIAATLAGGLFLARQGRRIQKKLSSALVKLEGSKEPESK